CHYRKRRNVCVPLHPADRKRQVAVLIVRPSAVDWHAKQRDEERAADDRCESNRKIDALGCHFTRGPDQPERDRAEAAVVRVLPDKVESRVSRPQRVRCMSLIEVRLHGEKPISDRRKRQQHPRDKAACPWSFSPLATSLVAYPLASLHLVHGRQDGIKPLLQ